MAYDRGRIAVGLTADLILFDYQALADKATMADPQAVSVGMRHVLVAGVPVLKDGEMTEARPRPRVARPRFTMFSEPRTTFPQARNLPKRKRLINCCQASCANMRFQAWRSPL